MLASLECITNSRTDFVQNVLSIDLSHPLKAVLVEIDMVHEQKVMFYYWTVIFDFDFVLLFTPADTVFSISIFPYLN